MPPSVRTKPNRRARPRHKQQSASNFGLPQLQHGTLLPTPVTACDASAHQPSDPVCDVTLPKIADSKDDHQADQVIYFILHMVLHPVRETSSFGQPASLNGDVWQSSTSHFLRNRRRPKTPVELTFDTADGCGCFKELFDEDAFTQCYFEGERDPHFATPGEQAKA